MLLYLSAYRLERRTWLRTGRLVVAAMVGVGVGVIMGSSAPAEAAWGWPPPRKLAVPPDQSWLADVPERLGARSRGKVAVFEFRGDDVYQPVRGAVVRVLRRKAFNVTVTLRPVETAAEYREISHASKLAVYIAGEMRGAGARQKAAIHLFSGITGKRMATMKFSGPTDKVVADIHRTLWSRVGPAIARTCSVATRARRRVRAPMLIDASDAADNQPS